MDNAANQIQQPSSAVATFIGNAEELRELHRDYIGKEKVDSEAAATVGAFRSGELKKD